MTEASGVLMRVAAWGVLIMAILFGDWWRRRRAKRNAALREVLRRPSE